jgi:hypothetical protein
MEKKISATKKLVFYNKGPKFLNKVLAAVPSS